MWYKIISIRNWYFDQVESSKQDSLFVWKIRNHAGAFKILSFWSLYLLVILTFISCADSRTADENYKSGLKYFSEGKYTDALKEFTIASEKAPNVVDIQFHKALTEVQLDSTQLAFNSLKKVIEIDDKYYMAFVERAKLKIILGDFVGAISDCDKASFIRRDYGDIYSTKAFAYENLKDEANCAIALETLLGFEPQNAKAYYRLGVLKLSQGLNEAACELLRKAGDLGDLEAFKIIKTNCNSKSQNTKVTGQFKIYPKKFSITFPRDWKVDEISNKDKTSLIVTASKDGYIMTVLEDNPKILRPEFKETSLWKIDKEEFIKDSREKYSDFKLIKHEKMKINDIEAYYFKFSSSFFSRKLNRQIGGITFLFVLLNPRTINFTYLMSYVEPKDQLRYEETIIGTFNTFKFES